MADTIYAPDPWSALAAQHSDIRREGSVERGEIRYDIATKTGDVRRELANGIDETKFAVATTAGDLKYAVAEHSEDTNRDIFTSGFNTQGKVDEVGDAILQRTADFFIAGQARDFDNARDLAALRATTDLSAQRLSLIHI